MKFEYNHQVLLTPKLIWPPIENVRLRWANFSQDTQTWNLNCMFLPYYIPNIIKAIIWSKGKLNISIFGEKERRKEEEPMVLLVVTLSYFSNSSLSSWLQFRPIGDTFSMPLRNSINVPLEILKNKSLD